MGNLYSRALSEEVAPEMRSAIKKACTLLAVQAFVVDLDDDSCLDGKEAAGSDKGCVSPRLHIGGVLEAVNCAPDP